MSIVLGSNLPLAVVITVSFGESSQTDQASDREIQLMSLQVSEGGQTHSN